MRVSARNGFTTVQPRSFHRHPDHGEALRVVRLLELDLAALAALAEWQGWSPEDAFLMAMQMRAAGIGAGQAAAAFRDASERVQ